MLDLLHWRRVCGVWGNGLTTENLICLNHREVDVKSWDSIDCQNHRLNGLLDFADWDLSEGITQLNHFVITHLNPPLKMELQTGRSSGASRISFSIIFHIPTICRFSHFQIKQITPLGFFLFFYFLT